MATSRAALAPFARLGRPYSQPWRRLGSNVLIPVRRCSMQRILICGLQIGQLPRISRRLSTSLMRTNVERSLMALDYERYCNRSRLGRARALVIQLFTSNYVSVCFTRLVLSNSAYATHPYLPGCLTRNATSLDLSGSIDGAGVSRNHSNQKMDRNTSKRG